MAKIITLPSGLRVFFSPNKNTASVTIGVFIGVGSNYEDEKTNGLSHFLEHMTFKGTSTRSAFDISDQMEKIGAMINAYTTRSYTTFYTVSLDRFFEQCTEMLSDIIFNSTYDTVGLEKERKVVIEEINMYQDDNEDLCIENLHRAYFAKSTLAYPILGTKETVASFEKETIMRFKEKFYKPSNMVISVAGNVAESTVLSLVSKYFDDKLKKEDFVKGKPKRNAPHSKMVKTIKPIEQANVAIAFRGRAISDKKTILTACVCEALAGSMSSRFYQKIREEKGLVYEIYATCNPYENDGYAYLFFATSPNQTIDAIKAIKEVLDEIKEKGFTQAELNKVKIQSQTSLAIGSENSTALMRVGGKVAIMQDKCFSVSKKIAEYDKITLQELNEEFLRMYDKNRLCMSYVGIKNDDDLLSILKGE